MLKEFEEKLKLTTKVKALNIIDEIKLISSIIKYWFTKQNNSIDIEVQVDGLKYKLLDIESLFIVSPRYEGWMWKYLQLRRGDIFIDVGAHIGKYALRAARIVGNEGRVIAIEPDPENFQALMCCIYLNKLTNVVPLNIAAWHKECELHLYVGRKNGKYSSSGLLGKGSSSLKRKVGTEVVSVSAKPLDNIAEELRLYKCDWIKIDVEGSEYEVLKGSKKIIRNFRPKIIVECTVDRERTHRFMKNFEYTAIPIAANYFFLQPK